MYENTARWEDSVPADLIPAVEHLRELFDRAHWGYGHTSQRFCYSVLHNTPVDDPAKEYFNYLMHMKVFAGAAATQRFHDLVKQQTPPALFKAFMDFYLDCLTVEALRIFQELVQIGRAHRNKLATSYIGWAQAQCSHLVRSHRHNIRIWVQDVCEMHRYDPDEDPDERIYWRKWQAPMFLMMKPSRYQPFEPGAAWDRMDAETSQRWLDRFADDYVLHLEVRIKRAAGDAKLELAKRPESSEVYRDYQPGAPQDASAVRPQFTSAKREVRKAESQAMYKRWQKEYRDLKNRRPEMSDVWYSQQIAKLSIAKGCSAETIRKRMKR